MRFSTCSKSISASSTQVPAAVLNPADLRDVVGYVQEATVEDADNAIQCALNVAPIWQATPPTERAAILERAADQMEAEIQPLMGLAARPAATRRAARTGPGHVLYCPVCPPDPRRDA